MSRDKFSFASRTWWNPAVRKHSWVKARLKAVEWRPLWSIVHLFLYSNQPRLIVWITSSIIQNKHPPVGDNVPKWCTLWCSATGHSSTIVAPDDLNIERSLGLWVCVTVSMLYYYFHIVVDYEWSSTARTVNKLDEASWLPAERSQQSVCSHARAHAHLFRT